MGDEDEDVPDDKFEESKMDDDDSGEADSLFGEEDEPQLQADSSQSNAGGKRGYSKMGSNEGNGASQSTKRPKYDWKACLIEIQCLLKIITSQ